MRVQADGVCDAPQRDLGPCQDADPALNPLVPVRDRVSLNVADHNSEFIIATVEALFETLHPTCGVADPVEVFSPFTCCRLRQALALDRHQHFVVAVASSIY